MVCKDSEIDFKGLRQLKIHEQTDMKFIIPRYADLLHDTYVVVNLPNIYSSVYWPSTSTKGSTYDKRDYSETFEFRGAGYEFKWIENIGAQMIQRITITGGGQILSTIFRRIFRMFERKGLFKNKKRIME